MWIQNAFIGLALIGLGVLMLKYAKETYESIGVWNWAEKFFGIGGTITAMKLTAIVMIVV